MDYPNQYTSSIRHLEYNEILLQDYKTYHKGRLALQAAELARAQALFGPAELLFPPHAAQVAINQSGILKA